jgi:hypothetical protein
MATATTTARRNIDHRFPSIDTTPSQELLASTLPFHDAHTMGEKAHAGTHFSG